MIVALGNDHAGFPLKAHVRADLERLGHEVVDVGTHGSEPVDFPDIAKAVCAPVLAGEAARGVLVCGTGVGAAIAVSSSTVRAEPFSDPAMRLIVSSISVPPMSSAPPCRICAASSSPSFTHEHWTWSMRPCRASRANACTARLSRVVGPGRAIPAR